MTVATPPGGGNPPAPAAPVTTPPAAGGPTPAPTATAPSLRQRLWGILVQLGPPVLKVGGWLLRFWRFLKRHRRIAVIFLAILLLFLCRPVACTLLSISDSRFGSGGRERSRATEVDSLANLTTDELNELEKQVGLDEGGPTLFTNRREISVEVGRAFVLDPMEPLESLSAEERAVEIDFEIGCPYWHVLTIDTGVGDILIVNPFDPADDRDSDLLRYQEACRNSPRTAKFVRIPFGGVGQPSQALGREMMIRTRGGSDTLVLEIFYNTETLALRYKD